MTRGLLQLLSLLIALAAPRFTRAQPSQQQLDAARALAEAGLELYKKKDYAAAYERFRGAEDIFHAPPHLLFMARCKVEVGELARARVIYLELAEEDLGEDAPEAFRDDQKTASEELAALEPRVPRVTVRVSGEGAAEAQITIDGNPMIGAGEATFVDPGTRLVAAAVGDRKADQAVTLAAGDKIEVALTLPPPAKEEPKVIEKHEADLGWVPPAIVLGIGGVGLIVGAVAGGIALGKADDLKAACPDLTMCPEENQPIEEEARTFGALSTIAFVAGGAIAAGGVTWLLIVLMSDDSASETGEAIEATPGGLRVRF